MDMIETKALEFAYPAEEGEKPVLALRGVDTAIEKGSFVVVLGHNGSGKSTFAKQPERHFAALRRQGVCGGHGYAGRGVSAGDPPHGWAWCSRIRTTRSSPTWWRRMWPLPRKI